MEFGLKSRDFSMLMIILCEMVMNSSDYEEIIGED